jgi:hypothetical protein
MIEVPKLFEQTSTVGTNVLQEPAGSIFMFAAYTEDTNCSCSKTVDMCLPDHIPECNSNIQDSQNNKSHILQSL